MMSSEISHEAHPEPILSIANLYAGHQGVPVVRDLELEVRAGEVVLLLGPNGAGKTTTLLTVSGILPAIQGQILAFGRSVRGKRPHQVARSGVAYVPDDRGLFANLTVKDNLVLAARRQRLDLGSTLSIFPDLERLLGRRAGLLSGGEQQMLALARGLASNPRLLMIDEMSVGLAPQIVEKILGILRQVADRGIGILLVEQYVGMALGVADRACVLVHGEAVLQCSARELNADLHRIEAAYMGDGTSSLVVP
jgi:branched-chain amino acid transport system ATP-binding protein